MERKTKITGPGIPNIALPFSPAIRSGDFVFVSGQASVDLDGNIVKASFDEECRRSFENIRAVLKAAGLGFEDVVQVRAYVANQADLPEFNAIYKEYFSEPYPARSTLMGCLGDLLKFEMDVMARIKG